MHTVACSGLAPRTGGNGSQLVIEPRHPQERGTDNEQESLMDSFFGWIFEQLAGFLWSD